eukprot:155596-Alexandrium_andersonii.AAC.1
MNEDFQEADVDAPMHLVPQERSDTVPGGEPASSSTEVQPVKKSHKKKKDPLSGGRTAKQKAEQGPKLY